MQAQPLSIDARFRWARQQGHPWYLWPDVPVDVWRSCVREVESAVQQVLGGQQDVRLKAPASVPGAMGIAAFTSGMGPLLGYWIERGQIETDPATAQSLQVQRDHARQRAARLTAELHRIVPLLAPLGPVVLVKSAHTMFEVFPEPATRPCSDLDLVIPAARLADAGRLLRGCGYSQTSVRQPDKSEWIPPDAPTELRSIDLVHCDNPYTVELHGTFGRAFAGIGTLSLEGTVTEIAQPAPEIVPGGYVLRGEHLALYHALHVADELHRLQLIRVVELALILRRDAVQPGYWTTLVRTAQNIGAGRFVFAALELVERLCPATIPFEVRDELRKNASVRLMDYLSGRRVTDYQRLETLSLSERFLWTAGWSEGARRLQHLVLPAGRPLSLAYRERLFRILRGKLTW